MVKADLSIDQFLILIGEAMLTVEKNGNKIAKDLAQVYVDKVKGHIDNQDLSSMKTPEHSAKWAKKKSSDKYWHENGDLYDAIKVTEETEEKGYFAGITEETDSKQVDKAWALEAGWAPKNIPARPLFEPTARELEDFIDQNEETIRSRSMGKLGKFLGLKEKPLVKTEFSA